MTKTSTKFSLKKFLQICLLTFAVFSNVSLAIAVTADYDADVYDKAVADKLQKAASDADKNREAFSKFNISILKADGQAQGYLKNSKKTSTNPLASFILQIINFITITAGSLSFLAVVIGGFMIMSSAGNENQINKGKDILKHAVIGLVITLTAYFVVAFVQSLLFETVK